MGIHKYQPGWINLHTEIIFLKNRKKTFIVYYNQKSIKKKKFYINLSNLATSQL